MKYKLGEAIFTFDKEVNTYYTDDLDIGYLEKEQLIGLGAEPVKEECKHNFKIECILGNTQFNKCQSCGYIEKIQKQPKPKEDTSEEIKEPITLVYDSQPFLDWIHSITSQTNQNTKDIKEMK